MFISVWNQNHHKTLLNLDNVRIIENLTDGSNDKTCQVAFMDDTTMVLSENIDAVRMRIELREEHLAEKTSSAKF